MERKVINCACNSSEHIILYSFDEDEDGYKCVFISYHLSSDYWYRRIWKGIKYIFGFKSQYGNFGEIIIDDTNVSGFREIVGFIDGKPKYKLENLLEDVTENNIHPEINL